MKFITSRTLFILAVVVITSNAFSPNAFTSSHTSTKSSSSTTSSTASSTASSTGSRTCSQSSLFRKAAAIHPYSLLMTNDDNNSKEDEEKDVVPMLQERTNDDPSSSSSSPKSITQAMNKAQQDKSALLTILLIAPPLIAKFGIVILVKIVTDMVVFPLLYMYRFCHIAKSKVTELIFKPQQQIMKGDKINGAS